MHASNKNPNHLVSSGTVRTVVVIGAILVGLCNGCASVPPQVSKLHQRELEIIESLQSAHLAMVDAYVDQKLRNFESFFFDEYGPVYLEHWMDAFKTVYNREYDSDRDFATLYNDLVAEYQAESAPIEEIRVELRAAIAAEYRNAIGAHNAVGGWIDSMEKLNSAQRHTIDSLLATIKPGLSLGMIGEAVEAAKENVERRIAELSQ